MKENILIGLLILASFGLLAVLSDLHSAVPQIRTTVIHNSYFSTSAISDAGFAKSSEVEPIAGVQGILVNHHLLAPDLVAAEFVRASLQDPELVVLISPNHFTRGNGRIIITGSDWQTPYGMLKGAKELAENLDGKNDVFIDEIPFEKEHGISGIVPFIEKQFPHAKVLPVIFKDYVTAEEAKQFIVELLPMVPEKTLFVGSFDFSHDSIIEIARARDEKSKGVLMANNPERIYGEVSVDSKPGLYAFMYAMKIRNTEFHLDANTNSSEIIDIPDQPDVTSYITGYYK